MFVEQSELGGEREKFLIHLIQSDTQAKIDTLGKEVSRQKHIVAGLKPGVQCPMCKQTVTEATLPQVRHEFTESVNDLCRQGREQTAQLNELKVLSASNASRSSVEEGDAEACSLSKASSKQADTEKAEAALAELNLRRSNLVGKAQQDRRRGGPHR